MYTCTEEKFHCPVLDRACVALVPGSRTTVTNLTLEGVSRHPEELDDEMFCLGVYQVAGLLERLGVESTSYLQTVPIPCTHANYTLFPSECVCVVPGDAPAPQRRERGQTCQGDLRAEQGWLFVVRGCGRRIQAPPSYHHHVPSLGVRRARQAMRTPGMIQYNKLTRLLTPVPQRG